MRMGKATIKSRPADRKLPDWRSPRASVNPMKPDSDRAMFPIIEQSSDKSETIDQMNDRIAARFRETLKKLGE